MADEFNNDGTGQNGTEGADASQGTGQDGAGAGQGAADAGTGQQQTSWMDALDADFRNNPSIQKFTNVNGLAKSYLESQKLIGRDKIVIPKDENDAAAWDGYRKAFGIPENASKYDIKIEGVELKDTELESFKGLAFQHKVTNAAAQDFLQAHINGINEYEQAKQNLITEKGKQVTAELNKEWGLAAEKNWALAKGVLGKLCESDEQLKEIQTELGNNAHFIKFLHKVGSSISEGGFDGFGGQGGGNGFTLTPAQAQAELDKINNDSNHAYWAGTKNQRNNYKWCQQHNASFVSPEEHKEAVKHYQSLIEMSLGAQA